MRILPVIILLFFVEQGFAQLKPDTSFSVKTEFEKLRKEFPFIQPVNESSTSGLTVVKDLVYCSVGKRKLLVDVFSPAEVQHPGPAIMIIHGGGWRSGNKEQHHAMAIMLAKMGYVCFTPEYRLSGEALYPAAVEDLRTVLRWIHANASTYKIDTSKIAVAGFSAGGQLAALLGTTMHTGTFTGNGCSANFSTQFNAIIDMDGILAFIHPGSGEGNDVKKISAATRWFGVSKSEDPLLWKQASALTHVNALTPPVLFINSSVKRMHAGRDDFIHILNEHGIYTEVKTFEGAPHSFPLFHPWFDSTIVVIDQFLDKVFNETKANASAIIVAADGSGDHTTIQSAFNSIPVNNTKPVIVYVRNGIYKQKLVLDSSKRFITLLGENKFNTIISYNDHAGRITSAGDTINTYSSHSFLAAADDFTAKNISFENPAGFTAGQAVAVQVKGDRVKFINCRFTGNQDVLFTSQAGTRQYFENCYIEGTTDFIFGASTAWFEQCHIHSKKNSHVTAASTPKESRFGYVFNDCIVTGDTSLHNVSLGRPWGPFANVVYMNCFIGAHIKVQGWSNWNNTDRFKTARFAEYNNYGPSSPSQHRLPWIKQLSEEEANAFSIKNVLGNWDPENEKP